MKRIETEILIPRPENKGMHQYVGQRKTQEVFKELEDLLKEENLYPEEYFHMTHGFEEKYPLFPRMLDCFCYANWGGNEGVYLDIELLIENEKEQKREQVHFATGKTLNESTEALERMQYIACKIYQAFMGSDFTPSRYMILPTEDPRKQITHERLISKLENECKQMLKERLLHKQEPLHEIAGEIGFTLQILDVLKEPQTFADLPNDKLRELYETDGVMHRLYSMTKRIREADRWEIGDIIASERTLLKESDDEEVKRTETIPADAYYGFTHYSRMNYSDMPLPDGALDEIMFGIYVRGGGCIAEAGISWERLQSKDAFLIRIYDDGLQAAFSQKFLAVVAELKQKEFYTPDEVARILICNGFEDRSDRPLNEKG